MEMYLPHVISTWHAIIPVAMSLSGEKEEREFAAKMSARVYKKLHEIALKGICSTTNTTNNTCYL